MAGTLKSLEIFAAGTWKPGNAKGKSVTVTEEHLDEMVESFNALKTTNIVKPHLKLGHDDAQKWFGQRNGVPTLGWIEKVWRQGNKLFADIGGIPDAVIDLIKQGRYHNVSAEIYSPGAVEHNGQKFGHVLSAVALLGAEMPAVKTLSGLAKALFQEQPLAYSDDVKPIIYTSQQEKAVFTQEQVDSLVDAAVQKAKEDIKGEFSAKVEELEAKVGDLTKRAEKAEQDASKYQEMAAYAEAEGIVDKAISEGKLLPKQKDAAMAFCKATAPLKFAEGEKSVAQLFQDFIGMAKPQIDVKEKANSSGEERTQFATVYQEVDYLVKEYQNKNGGQKSVKYEDALTAVLNADAELKARYAENRS